MCYTDSISSISRKAHNHPQSYVCLVIRDPCLAVSMIWLEFPYKFQNIDEMIFGLFGENIPDYIVTEGFRESPGS
jgi:hypothetical protein